MSGAGRPTIGTGGPGRRPPASGEAQPSAGLQQAALRPWSVLAIAVAAISPTTSVFLIFGGDLASSGTGIVWAFVIGGVIALAMALC